MKSKYVVAVLLLFQSITCLTAQNEKVFESRLLNNDLHILKNILYTSHPSTFDYVSKDSLDTLFDKLHIQDNKKYNQDELEKRIRIILSSIGCIHTSVFSTSSPFSFLLNKKPKVIPLGFFIKNQSIWIRNVPEDSLKYLIGSQVLSINNHSTSEMLAKMKDYHPADGYNQVFKYQILNSKGKFQKLYNYYFDTDTVKKITLVTVKKDTISIIVETTKFKKEKRKKNAGRSYGSKTFLSLDTTQNLATLKINSFMSPSFMMKPRYKKIILKLKKNKIENLVIDLRDNLGGSVKTVIALLRHFVHSNQTISCARNSKTKLKKYETCFSKMFFLNRVLGENIIGEKTKTDSIISIEIPIIQKTRTLYKGNIYVLVNGLTASGASITASILQHTNKAIVIGQETGGGNEKLNAINDYYIKLPNTGIQIKIPRFRIELNQVKNTGSGVKPDYKINYTIADVMEERDLEMEKVLSLIGSKEAAEN